MAFEREDSAEKQVKTDKAHQVQMQRLQEVCSADVTGWKPPEGVKDMAALNLHQVQQAEHEAAQRAAQAQKMAWERAEAAKPEPSYPTPG